MRGVAAQGQRGDLVREGKCAGGRDARHEVRAGAVPRCVGRDARVVEVDRDRDARRGALVDGAPEGIAALSALDRLVADHAQRGRARRQVELGSARANMPAPPSSSGTSPPPGDLDGEPLVEPEGGAGRKEVLDHRHVGAARAHDRRPLRARRRQGAPRQYGAVDQQRKGTRSRVEHDARSAAGTQPDPIEADTRGRRRHGGARHGERNPFQSLSRLGQLAVDWWRAQDFGTMANKRVQLFIRGRVQGVSPRGHAARGAPARHRGVGQEP